jgi:hypothetical protein
MTVIINLLDSCNYLERSCSIYIRGLRCFYGIRDIRDIGKSEYTNAERQDYTMLTPMCVIKHVSVYK